MINLLVQYQWELFIFAEVLSVISLFLFGIVRYLFGKQRLSLFFLLAFLVLLVFEALLAMLIYQETGEISTFQIVITIFVIYACTFGIADFRKLDRWMRSKIGKWRGVKLLTDKDIAIMSKQKDPGYIAKKYRRSAMLHLAIFTAVQLGIWLYTSNSTEQFMQYITDLSWVSMEGTENLAETPYPNELLYGLSQLWALVFVIDFLYSWSYTVFPANRKGEKA
ncbi:hypothetical protein [Lentibacillus sediminis]|uniref:hypothetical protein n=1 Tax=Lentibacillus sediminis TaxID=1940529 RepID=UPI000C1C1C13|nr:hypothetical protein [Lentibacillus sediminis]